MPILYRLTLAFFIAGLLASCATRTIESGSAGSNQKAASTTAPLYPEVSAWLEQNRMVVNAGLANVPEYTQAFSQGAVIALGEGFPLAETDEPGKKRLTAVRAAEAVAQRNLLDFFARFTKNNEIRLDSYSVRLEGFLKGAVIVASDYNQERERAAVLLRLDLKGAQGFDK